MNTSGDTPLDRLYRTLPSIAVDQWDRVLGNAIDPAVEWHVAYPVNTLDGADAVIDGWLMPLLRALPDLERRPLISLSSSDGSGWTAGTGHFLGTFTHDLFDIPATGRVLYLRYTELARLRDDRVVESYIIPDFLDAMLQAGVYPLRPALGHSGLIPAPATLDGVSPYSGDHAHSADTTRLVMEMLDGLRQYDGVSLESMDLHNFWHPDFMWYGPGGIGTTRGIRGFREQHQGPFLTAFPDRDVDHHACTVACGDYVATGGWPHMHGTHTGSGWLGLEASGGQLEMRVMDIWRREGDLLKENWVAIDICHMCQQMGVDIFERMRRLKEVH